MTYRSQGYEAQQRGDHVTALAFYQKAAQLDPTYPTPHNDAGVLLEEQGRLQDAEREYQQAIVLNPDYAEAHANLAMLYERMGQKDQAIIHWLKRYQLGDPSSEGTARAEERLMALGMLKRFPGMKGVLYNRRRATSQEFESHAKSLDEYHSLTEQYGDWP